MLGPNLEAWYQRQREAEEKPKALEEAEKGVEGQSPYNRQRSHLVF